MKIVNFRQILPILLSACLLLAPFYSQAAQAAQTEGDGQPQFFRYSGPAGSQSGNYALSVLQKGPEFTEEELLRYCADSYLKVAQGPQVMLTYMVQVKGWDSDRVYYLMAKIVAAEAQLAAEAGGGTLPDGGEPAMRATPRELELVRKHQDQIPEILGGNRAVAVDPASSKEALQALVEGSPDLSEEELTRALADAAGGAKLSVPELADRLEQKGWERNRAFYALFRIRIGYLALKDKRTWNDLEADFARSVPSPAEAAMLKKHMPELKALRYQAPR